MTGNYLFLTGMLLSFGTILVICFLVFAIVMIKRLFLKIEEFTTLCVEFKQLILEAEDTKKKTAKLYEDAQAEKKYDVVNGEIKLVPKIVEEVG